MLLDRVLFPGSGRAGHCWSGRFAATAGQRSRSSTVIGELAKGLAELVVEMEEITLRMMRLVELGFWFGEGQGDWVERRPREHDAAADAVADGAEAEGHRVTALARAVLHNVKIYRNENIKYS